MGRAWLLSYAKNVGAGDWGEAFHARQRYQAPGLWIESVL